MPALNALSPTARLWSRPGIESASARGNRLTSFRGSPAIVSSLADRDQRRAGGARASRRRSRARAAGAGGEREAVAVRLLGEGAEQALRRVVEALERRRLHGLGDRLRQAFVAHEPVAETPEHERAHEAGVFERKQARDPRAHRIPHHVGALDPQNARAGWPRR